MSACDLLIIGAGPAAWSCAITARQRGLHTVVACAQSDTSWLLRAERIDNYPGLPHVSGKALLRIFRAQAVELGTEIIEQPARQIMLTDGGCMTLIGNDIIESRALVLAAGAARPKLLPGENELLGQGVSWCGTCDGMFYRGKRIAVLSAWHGGIEEAEYLATLASEVDYYMLARHDLPPQNVFRLRDERPLSLRRENNQIVLATDHGAFPYDGVFIFRPTMVLDTLLPGVALDGAFIKVDRQMATNLPHIYACGDCTGQPFQIAKAVGEGNIAAISASADLKSAQGENA